MTSGNAPDDMNGVAPGIPLKHKNRRSLAERRIVLPQYATRNPINDVSNSNGVLSHFVISVLGYSYLARCHQIPNLV
jgi:hypothetical protein